MSDRWWFAIGFLAAPTIIALTVWWRLNRDLNNAWTDRPLDTCDGACQWRRYGVGQGSYRICIACGERTS